MNYNNFISLLVTPLRFDKTVLPCIYSYSFGMPCLSAAYTALPFVTCDIGLQKLCKQKGCNKRANMLPVQWSVRTISYGFRKPVKCCFIELHLIMCSRTSKTVLEQTIILLEGYVTKPCFLSGFRCFTMINVS